MLFNLRHQRKTLVLTEITFFPWTTQAYNNGTFTPISSVGVVVPVPIGYLAVVATFERLQAVLPQSLKHGRTSAVVTVAADAPVA